MTVWVVVSPHGLEYAGLHDDEESAWRVALGWPSAAEINEKKAAGWYAALAEITWRKP